MYCYVERVLGDFQVGQEAARSKIWQSADNSYKVKNFLMKFNESRIRDPYITKSYITINTKESRTYLVPVLSDWLAALVIFDNGDQWIFKFIHTKDPTLPLKYKELGLLS